MYAVKRSNSIQLLIILVSGSNILSIHSVTIAFSKRHNLSIL